MSQVAYLVIREGTKWSDVFRLIPDQSTLIGRAPTNQIVIKDERCSRTHMEVFYSGGQWIARDLDSRNGTMVGDEAIQGDRTLNPGDVIRIGRTQLAFVYKLSDAFSDARPKPRRTPSETAESLEAAGLDSDPVTASESEPTTITHRRVRTRYLTPGEDDAASVSRIGRAATRLCRLAFELTKATDEATLAQTALAGLAEGTQTDAGGILLAPRDLVEEARYEDLQVTASRSSSEHKYRKISSFLASTVLREGEAVMARNLAGDSSLANRDTQGEILATSVICAPIRRGRKILGLIHLYSTSPHRQPDPDDLEYALATADALAVALENLQRREELAENLTQVRTENVQLLERLGVQTEIVGASAPMRRVAEEIARAASAANSTVLIRGESGVGKELVAGAVHFNSPRRDHPFICLNCAALSPDLLASELFGHERGSFTGATERKIGKFESAHKGTLMLDEIGEMALNIQAKFLRVLEGHAFERVGGNKPITVDVRVISATNRDLEKEVSEGRFRRDLFFRLRVLEIVVPALRKRADDVPLLADFFLRRFNNETGRRIRGFSDSARAKLLEYQWPGNVRELKNVIERAVVLCRSDVIDDEDLLLTSLATASDSDVRRPVAAEFEPISLEEMEKRHIHDALEHTEWNKSKTANILGIERSTLDRKIRRYGLDGGDAENGG